MSRVAPQFVEVRDAAGRGLRATFVWSGDRFSHAVALVDGQRLTPLAASGGCCQDGDWPDSPPFQQLSVEEHAPGRTAALLVGMAGKSHWSASVEPTSDRRGLLFDVAVRMQRTPEFLGSTYRLQTAPVQIDSRTVRWEVGGGVCRLTLPDDTSLALVCDDATVAVRHVAPPPAPPATLRWRYALTLEPKTIAIV